MPDWFPKSLTGIYSIVYNYSYILTEMTVTLIIINIPAVRHAIERIRNQVTDLNPEAALNTQ